MTEGLAPDGGPQGKTPEDVELRPLGVGEQLDVALKICTTHWQPLLKAVLFPVVPAAILTTLLTLSTLPEGSTGEEVFFGPDPGTGEGFAVFLGGQVASTLLGIVVALLVFGACFRVVAEAYVGAGPDWRESLRFALRRILPLLWLTIVYTLGVMLGFIALIVPAIWLSVAWALSFPALYAEEARGTKALKRSYGLVRDRWWATAIVLIVGYILSGILGLVGTFAFGLLFLVDIDSVLIGAVLTTLGNIVGQAISAPVLAAILAVTYFDLRVRKEGFDLELLAQRIGTRRDPHASSPAQRHVPAPASGAEPPPYWPPPPGWQPGDRT